MKKTAAYLRQKKADAQKITMLTCYDYPTAQWEDEAGVDIIFVGDSVGTNVLGYESEKEVTVEDMIHHLKAVRRGVTDAYLMVDTPYQSCETPEQAIENVQRFLAHGADGVKVEGVKPDIVQRLVDNGVEVCSHIGLTPQLQDGPSLQAKTAETAAQFVADAVRLEAAGATLLLFELVPEEVGRHATKTVAIPTIGIGAGRYTDGQVLVVLDLLGMNPGEFRHNKKYEALRDRAVSAIGEYVAEVEAGSFPAEENFRHMAPDALKEFERLVQG